MPRTALVPLALLPLVLSALLAAPALASHEESHPAVKVDILPRGISWPTPEPTPLVVFVYNNEPTTRWLRVEAHPEPGSGWRLASLSRAGEDDFVDFEVPVRGTVEARFALIPPDDLGAVPERSIVTVAVRNLNSSTTLESRDIPVERHDQPYGLGIALEREDYTVFHGLRPGERRSFDLRVTNREATQAAAYFRVWQPDSPYFEVAPSMAVIEPGSSTIVHVTVAAPLEARPGFWAREDAILFEAMIGNHATSDLWIGMTETVAPVPTAGESLRDAAREHPVALGATLAGLAALALALLARAREWLQWLLLAPTVGMFTRIRAPDALGHPLRARIHAVVAGTPGITLTEIRAATGTRLGTLVHHLRALERHGILTSRRDGAFRRFFVAGATAQIASSITGVTPTQREVLRLLEAGPLTQRAIADALGVTRQAANAHVKTLERAGRVRVGLADGEWRVALVDEPLAGSARDFHR